MPTPADAGAVVLTHLAETPFFGTRARIEGLRLIATDAQASIGGGAAEVHGPIQDLLLVATGRPAGLNGVTGAGVSLLRNRLTGD